MVSVASMSRGAMPNSSGLNSTGVEEPAAAGVGHVRPLRVGVEVVVRVPVRRRHVGDAVDAVLDVGPEEPRPGRLREQAADADDRQRGSELGSSYARHVRVTVAVVDLVSRRQSGAVGKHSSGKVHAVLPQRLPAQDRRTPRRAGSGRPSTTVRFARLLEERPLRPLVERAHRRAAPHLVVELPARLAGVRPPARQPEVPAEHERHPVLRVGLGLRQLRRVAADEELLGRRPDLVEGRAEVRLLDLDALGLRDRLPARVVPVQFVELRRPAWRTWCRA